MARMVPPHVITGTRSPGERSLFYRFRDDPVTEGWVVLHSLNLARHHSRIEGEVDFVVLVPGLGILCLEVKATPRMRRVDGLWYYGDDQTGDSRGPFRQASEACHSLRAEVVKAFPTASQVVFWSAVCLPYLEFHERSAEWHDWQVIDRRAIGVKGLGSAVASVLAAARQLLRGKMSAAWFDPQGHAPTPEECWRIVEILRPSFEVLESSKAKWAGKQAEVMAFTEEQYAALDALEENPRVVLHGPAGTGKTLLAVETARRLSAAGRRVLLLCYNRLLARELAQEGTRAGIAKITSLHRHMLDLARESPGALRDAGQDYWRSVLPQKAVEGMVERPDNEAVWDAIVVDEAQDVCRPEYLDFLDLSLVGGLKSGTYRLFADFERQSIYTKDGREGLAERTDPVYYRLSVNCRNTPRVASLAHLLGGLEPDYSRVLRPDDGARPVLKFYTREAGPAPYLAESVESLLDEGFGSGDIVVLSTRANRPAASLLDPGPIADRVCQGGARVSGRILSTTIHAFKGLESPAVILTDFESIDGERAKDLFYIGVTRALHRLHIVASDEVRSQMLEILL